MQTFPKFSPIKTVLKHVKSNTPKAKPLVLPTIGYIGAPTPTGTKAVIELDNDGNVVATSSKAVQVWCEANYLALSNLFANLTNKHGLLPVPMTLTLVGYISADKFQLVDAQLAVAGDYSKYWLSLATLTEMVNSIDEITSVWTGAMYTEINFNQIDAFIGTPGMNWMPSPHSDTPDAIVYRDGFRIVS